MSSLEASRARPARKRLSAAERRHDVVAAVMRFVRQYGRKAQRGVEPNDRRIDRKAMATVRQMRPDALDLLLRDDQD